MGARGRKGAVKERVGQWYWHIRPSSIGLVTLRGYAAQPHHASREFQRYEGRCRLAISNGLVAGRKRSSTMRGIPPRRPGQIVWSPGGPPLKTPPRTRKTG